VTAGLNADDIGVAATTASEMSVEHAHRVAAVLDAEVELVPGSPLPLLWHWAFFAPAVPTSRLGDDGHPSLPTDGPTADLPRRMWAGGRLQSHAPLLLGEPAVRRSRVVGAERKSGRSGDLLVVTAAHEVAQGDRIVLTEEQDLIYRAAAAPARIEAPEGDVRPDVPDAGWRDDVAIGPAQLFRYSAVTFNSHRIHYDGSYATQVEGYPGLVVHGPLTATLLAESARRRGRSAGSFSFRASAPLFGGLRFSLMGTPDGDGGTELRAVRNDGAVSMTARLGAADA
jgi:3-methylfumaryl-CoA hydratase